MELESDAIANIKYFSVNNKIENNLEVLLVKISVQDISDIFKDLLIYSEISEEKNCRLKLKLTLIHHVIIITITKIVKQQFSRFKS